MTSPEHEAANALDRGPGVLLKLGPQTNKTNLGKRFLTAIA